MTLLILGAILIAAAVVVFQLRKKYKPLAPQENDGRSEQYAAVIRKRWHSGLLWGAVALLLLAVLALFFSSFRQVGTKEEGIGLIYGKTHGHYSAGPHLTLPWVAVKEFDAAIQTDSYTDDNSTDGVCKAIAVRIANQQTGCASISFQWRIKPEQVDYLYQNYRSFDHMRDALVTRKLRLAVNEALAHYNPLNAVGNPKGAQTLPEIGSDITGIMTREIGGQNGPIKVISTVLPLITYDKETQARINQLQQQVALTRIANQERLTNIAKSKANNALSNSVQNDPNVLVSRCFDILDTMIKNSQPVPAGFSCWPGKGVAAVIAGSK